MIALDTNVLVRYVTDDDERQSRISADLVARLSASQPGFIGQTVLVETFWVLRRAHGFSVARIHDLFDRLLDVVEIEIEDEESVSRALLHARAGADFADALIGDTAELFGCAETVTFDRRAAEQLGWRLLG